MPDAVHELLATEIALAKLGARDISAEGIAQLPRNPYVTLRNPHGGGEPGTQRFLIERTSGARVLTLVIGRTLDPTTWLIVTGWSATTASVFCSRGRDEHRPLDIRRPAAGRSR